MWFRFQNDPYIAYKFANEVGTADTKYFEIREVDPAVFSSGGFNRGGQDRQQEFVAYIQAIEQKVSSLEAQLKAAFAGYKVNVEPGGDSIKARFCYCKLPVDFRFGLVYNARMAQEGQINI